VVLAQEHKDLINWVHPFIPRIEEPYLSEVRAAQQGVAAKSPLVRLVDLDDIPLTTDSNHFDSTGLRVVGQRFADAYLAIVPSSPSGDFNQDGTVDASDYVVWRKGLGTTYTDGDYDLWHAHFGVTAGSGATLPSVAPPSAKVPEPWTVSVLSVGVLALPATCRLRGLRLWH
jgi:hypothetical protein